jgi:hypothetical protein
MRFLWLKSVYDALLSVLFGKAPEKLVAESGSTQDISEEERSQQIVQSIQTLRLTLVSAFWWGYVTDEVKSRLELVIDHLFSLGPYFRDSFISSYRYEHARRLVEGTNVPHEVPGALFGPAMPEESYRCGIRPVKFALDLNDWVEPNDADVQACMTVCHKIDEMREKGVIAPEKQTTSWSFKKVAIARQVEEQ